MKEEPTENFYGKSQFDEGSYEYKKQDSENKEKYDAMKTEKWEEDLSKFYGCMFEAGDFEALMQLVREIKATSYKEGFLNACKQFDKDEEYGDTTKAKAELIAQIEKEVKEYKLNYLAGGIGAEANEFGYKLAMVRVLSILNKFKP